MTKNFKIKNNLILLLKFLLFTLSCFLIYKNISNEKNIYKIFQDVDLKYIFFIFILSTLIIFVQIFIQFKTFLHTKNIKISFGYYSKIFFNSQMLSIILPHSGLFYKAYKLNKFGLLYKDFINIKLFLAWFYLCFLILLYSIEILIFGYEILKNFVFIIFFFGFLVSSSIFIIPHIFKKYIYINFKNKILLKIFKLLSNIVLSPLNYNKGKFFHFLISYGFISHILSFVVIYLLFLSLNINLSFSVIVLFFVMNSFLDQIPITPRNLAVSELIFGIVSSQIGLGFEFGVVVKLFLRLFFFVNLTMLSIIYNVVNHKKI